MTTALPARVLIVEDDPAWSGAMAELLAQVPEQPFATAVAPTLVEAIAAVGRMRFDAMLVDLALPDSAGAATVRTLRVAAPDVPIVVVTSSEGESIAESVIAIGAQDFIPKSAVNAVALARILWFAIRRERVRKGLVLAAMELRDEARLIRDGKVVNGTLDAICARLESIEHDLAEKSEGG